MKLYKYLVVNVFILFSVASVLGYAQVQEKPIPCLIEKEGRFALLVDNAPYFILGAQVNNSSSWPAMLPKVWSAMDFMHVNTVEMPVYWEQVEAIKNKYDFSVVDTLLTQARANQKRLILLWFATWKNGSPHYVPEWMKLDTKRFPHVIDEKGRPVDCVSPFCTEAMEADAKAFAALMGHLKKTDPQRTVLMVQVENEPGTGGWGIRDHSPYAENLFKSAVPEDVVKAMHVQSPETLPTWEQAFGKDADVCFHNWAVAKYIGKVAEAGKAVYPLPLFVNAASGSERGAAVCDSTKSLGKAKYEDGGPSGNILPIWKVSAPAVDMISPDNYAEDAAGYQRCLKTYQRKDNALHIPETGGSPRFFFFALGHQAIGFCPFGIDFTRIKDVPDLARPKDELLSPWARTGTKEFVAPFVQIYKMISPMAREIARWNFEGKLQATAEEQGKASQTLSFGNWDANISYGIWARFGKPAGNPQPMGGALVIQLGENEFIVSGFYCRVDFSPAKSDQKRNFILVEEGTYENGEFKVKRLLNGDQTDGGLDFSSEPLVMRVTVTSY